MEMLMYEKVYCFYAIASMASLVCLNVAGAYFRPNNIMEDFNGHVQVANAILSIIVMPSLICQ